MKKALITVLMILLLIPVFARTFSEEEFYEVYDALQETTQLLKEADATIETLRAQIEKLSGSNQELIEQLNSAKSGLVSAYSLLDKAEQELRNSAKVIDTLSNQKFFIGGGVQMRTDFVSLANFGAKVNAGYKIWLGYLVGEFSYYTDKSLGFGVSYNLVF